LLILLILSTYVLELIFYLTSLARVAIGKLAAALVHSAFTPIVPWVFEHITENTYCTLASIIVSFLNRRTVSPLVIELAAIPFAAAVGVATLVSAAAPLNDTFEVAIVHDVVHHISAIGSTMLVQR
jgi:hypothetical protein